MVLAMKFSNIFPPVKLLVLGAFLVFSAHGLASDVSNSGVDLTSPYNVTVQGDHQIRILEEGPAAYLERLKLIESAKSTLDIEYFIFKPDRSGQAIVQALKKKALEGVKIRILIDKSPLAPPLSSDIAAFLKIYNIEIRYFNPITIFSLGRSFHRSHRKFLIADKFRMVTGGRNIGDEYYINNKDFSFIDRDIYIEGPIVAHVVQTFEEFWNHHLASSPKMKRYHRKINASTTQKDLRKKRLRKAFEFIFQDKKGQSFIEKIIEVDSGDHKIAGQFSCKNLSFISDKPTPGKESRVFADAFYGELLKAEKSIIFETPYFITMKRDREILETLLEKNLDVAMVTNSTHSNNHPMVSNVLNRAIAGWVKKGMKAFFMTGDEPPCVYCSENSLAKKSQDVERKNRVFGLHSKSAVIDDSKSMFITFNMDPQSQLRSIEMGLFCHDGPELAGELKRLIEAHKQVSFGFNEDGRPDNGKGLLQGTTLIERLSYYFRIIPSFLMAPLL